jgi:hypothetical protein
VGNVFTTHRIASIINTKCHKPSFEFTKPACTSDSDIFPDRVRDGPPASGVRFALHHVVFCNPAVHTAGNDAAKFMAVAQTFPRIHAPG